MDGGALHRALRVTSWVVVAAMAGSIAWAGWISIAYWSGIGV